MNSDLSPKALCVRTGRQDNSNVKGDADHFLLKGAHFSFLDSDPRERAFMADQSCKVKSRGTTDIIISMNR